MMMTEISSLRIQWLILDRNVALKCLSVTRLLTNQTLLALNCASFSFFSTKHVLHWSEGTRLKKYFKGSTSLKKVWVSLTRSVQTLPGRPYRGQQKPRDTQVALFCCSRRSPRKFSFVTWRRVLVFRGASKHRRPFDTVQHYLLWTKKVTRVEILTSPQVVYCQRSTRTLSASYYCYVCYF